MRTGNKKERSLIEHIGTRLIVLLILLFVILAVIYQYTMHSMEENRITAAESTLELYRNDIDNRLKNAADSLDKVLYASEHLQDLQDASESRRYFASMEILKILENEMVYNDNADAYFVLEPSTQMHLVRFGSRVHTRQNGDINAFLKSELFTDDAIEKNSWHLQDIGQQSAFVKVYKIGSAYTGVLVLDTTAMENIAKSDTFDESGMLLTDESGHVFYASGEKKESFLQQDTVENGQRVIPKYNRNEILVTQELEQSTARISNYMERSSILRKISMVPYLIMVLALFTIIYLVYVYAFLRKKVIDPIDGLVAATQRVGQGEWETAVVENARIEELSVLEKSFNEMTAEIKNLKIASYEEQIERQKIELKYLQMQIKPHFYLNAMTTIHSMTYKNKNEQIRMFVEALSGHMRYTIREGLGLVTIAEEVSHVEEYIKMQEIRYTDNIFYMKDITEEAETFMIPPFLILTFIENTFKYAMDVEKLLSVYINCRKEKQKEEEYLVIRIEDNGPGYTEEMLEKLNADRQLCEGTEKGIGIWNVKKTLKLFYGDDFTIAFENGIPNGACVAIRIRWKDKRHEDFDRG